MWESTHFSYVFTATNIMIVVIVMIIFYFRRFFIVFIYV